MSVERNVVSVKTSDPFGWNLVALIQKTTVRAKCLYNCQPVAP